MSLLRLAPLALAVVPMVAADAAQFTFAWPGSPRLCDVVPLTWWGGEPPFQAWLIPTGGQPFIYDIPDSYYINGTGTYPILLQVSDGYAYTIMMSDANGIASGGTSEASIVQPMLSSPNSNTTLLSSQAPCLRNASENSTSLDFTFSVSGQVAQCATGLEVEWTGGKEMEPYNISVIPMDQGFSPWEIVMEKGTSWANRFLVNMTAGSRFTLMMNSKLGYGRGGVADIYEVTPSSSKSVNTTSCITQPSLPTGSWPAAATILSPLPSASRPPSPSNSSSSASYSNWGSPAEKKGKLAALSIGVTLLIALLAWGIWWLLMRRRRGSRMRVREKEGLESHFLTTTTASSSIVSPFSPSPSSATTPATNLYSLDLASSSGESVLASNTPSAGIRKLDTGRGSSLIGARDRSSSPASLRRTTSLHTLSDSQQMAEVQTEGGEEEEEKHQSYLPTPTPALRLSNPDTYGDVEADPQSHSLSTIPSSPHSSNRRRPLRPLRPERTYRRHADAGRLPDPADGRVGEGVVVDLPPLYSDVPRDRDGDGDGTRLGGGARE
ncbi:hypothetical protein L198_07289 [Cryptococcus wingfieldii CBS 7118]|uniref:Fibronectin type-III domain-containing protein n=1 Tax=Cryptococcus wingfieldii CBS 7118 TaxID=1295528 RepID=A0A1E3IDC4_9TREE|nr:hypothetical protein L198_07289 [Cryptococcus wingfieldii CBS 7118]ODN86594.1 hypothetical protein L198_07289 [Cryptococcus wingfieldii CBS 7118]